MERSDRPRRAQKQGGCANVMQNQGSSATLIELALIIVLIAIVVLAILLIIGDDLRLWLVAWLTSTLQAVLGSR